MISIVNTECHVPKTFSDLAKIAAWGRLGRVSDETSRPSRSPFSDRQGSSGSGDRHERRRDRLQSSRATDRLVGLPRSEEHTSELQSLMRISYAVFCLKKKK